ncbi:sensor histidine kinase [Neobacillus cucumis]|uniref:sensor histidine kinase n=1 Tax=Neobacillus cucumis TaxID=1740721 RepID=UPI002E229750|nr:histidine kinase [Neobacillus cucumis]MED4225498.1 histidine kinase [Neobacillus cucumis]
MSIRTKLFFFIPALIILLNMIFLFIFQSGKQVQESYNLEMDRILLYKETTDETEQNLRFLNQYLIKQDQVSLAELKQHENKLVQLRKSPRLTKQKGLNPLAEEDFDHMIETFIQKETDVIRSLQKQDLEGYTKQYAEAEKTVQFIKEQGENLIDLELSSYQPFYQNISKQTGEINKLGLSLVFVMILLSAALALLLSRSITDPISRLVHAARQVSRGNLAIEFPQFNKRNEIGILAETYSQMLKDIRGLMGEKMESLEKDKLVKELELKALQSQINPHFLFNTLNILSKLALIEGAEQTSDLTVSVSNLLRYNLRKLDQPVRLRDEVNHANEYFTIQKARFRDRVTFITEIDEEALDQLIPCLTLQPIIENAFVHGIEGMEQGALIRLTVKNSIAGVTITISDNGIGMSRQVRDSLLNEGKEKTTPFKGHTTGLGTKNVFKRLELFYGLAQIVEIVTDEFSGTTVIFNLPHKTQ